MRNLEPNLLLAISTGFAVVFLVIAASLYGPSTLLVRNVLMAIICAGGFVLLNPMLMRMTKQPARPPMVTSDNPGSALWASLFPVIVIGMAAVAVFLPGPDYGLMVIIGAVLLGAAVESAIKARAA